MAVDKNKIIAEATKLVQKGAWDKAIKAYEKILADDPKDVRILLKIGELHIKRSDDKAAATAFQKVAETYAEQGFFLKSVAVYKQIVKLDPDDVRVNERLAALYQQLGLMSDAMGQLQFMATAYEKLGDVAKLTDVLKRMVDLDPDNIASSIKLGELMARGGHAAPALECFRRAADYLKRQNRADEYLKVAERIAVLRPDDLVLTRELAHIYLAKGDTKRALAKLQLCFKADPKEVETLQLLAQAFKDLGQTAKTISVYKELARVHEERGRGADARATWRRVQELAPDDDDASAALGPPAHPAATRDVAPPPAPAPARPAAPPPARAPAAPVAAAAISAAPAAPILAAPVAPLSAAPGLSGGPEAVAKLLTETDVYVKYGLHDKAIDHLRKVLAIDPRCPDAHERAREIHAAANRLLDAAESGVLAVRALLARGLADRARDAVARLRQISPSHPDLGELNAAAGGTEEVVLVAVDEVVEDAATGALDEDLALAVAGDASEEIVDDEPVSLAAGRPPGEDVPAAEVAAVPVASDADRLAEEAAVASAEAEEIVLEPPAPPPPRRPAPAPGPRSNGKAAAAVRVPDLSDALEEADFFVQQGLLDEARESLEHLLAEHPEHPVVLARLAEVERRAAPAASPAPARETVPLAVEEADESFDIARELAGELGDAPDGGGGGDDEFQYSVEDVFSQFKKGVEQTVKPEDSATHYDLGIAYKEMALLDDAIHEFETALRGNDKRREVDCLSMIGLCRLAKGEPKEAIRAFRRALGSDTLTKEAAKAVQYELGAAYEAAGDAEVGLWFLQRVAKADAAFRDVAARVAALGGGPGRPPADARAAPRAAPAKPPPVAAKKNIGYL